MKKFIYFMFFIFAFSFVSFSLINVKGDDRLLSEMTEDECLEFIIDSGVTIPQSYVNSPVLKQFAKNTITYVENNPDAKFTYNFIDSLKLAEAIKDVVNDYYDNLNIIRGSRGEITVSALENSMIWNNGSWSFYYGNYKDKWDNYNCYAYAINRSEYPAQYTISDQYQVGDFSNSGSFVAGVTTVYDLASIVEDDLESLGMTNISIDNALPPDIGPNQRLIALRVGYSDYHFMKYDPITDAWYHKPGQTAVLKYIREMTNSWIWTSEAFNGARLTNNDSLYYDSPILFITYTPPYFSLSDDTTSLTQPMYLPSGRDFIYDINVEDDNDYKITVETGCPIYVYLYDYDMDLVPNVSPIYLNNNSKAIILEDLDEGNYFLRIKFRNDTDSSNVFTTCDKAYYNASSVFQGTNNVLSTLYQNDDDNYESHLSFSTQANSGIYQLSLSAYYGNNLLNSEGYIRVYDSIDRIMLCEKYPMLNNGEEANNTFNLMMYLDEYKTYYIDLYLPEHTYTSLNFSINKVSDYNINLFNVSENSNSLLISEANIPLRDSFYGLNINQVGKYKVQITGSNNGKFVLMKKVIDNDNISYNVIYNVNINNNYALIFNLTEGFYYIGFINANNASFMFSRLITDYGSYNLLPDSPNYLLAGTEVTINNGAYNSNIITQGFTRLIYLLNDDSRLDYYWYSSNENVAKVTIYGTVLGLNVLSDTSVYIMAVKKDNPSIAYVKEFIIKKDLETYATSPIIYNIYMNMNTGIENMVQIDLSNYNVPYNYLQYYEWNTSSDLISVDIYGRIIVDEDGDHDTYFITGEYYLNERVRINIVVSVGE